VRVGFCVSGQGTLYRAALLHRAAIGFDASLLVTESKAAADLETVSAKQGVEVVRLDPSDRPAFDRALTRTLLAADLDLIVLTFDRILPPELVDACRERIINVHPSLLPSFPGKNGIGRTVESGVLHGGATIHEVAEKVDTGRMIAQAVVPMIPGQQADVYGRRLYALLEPMYLQVLSWYQEGRVGSEEGGIVVKDALYGTLPISPALERFEIAR